MIGKFILIGYTLAMANGIIMILILIVTAEKMTSMCGFRTVAAYNSAFEFAFGILRTI